VQALAILPETSGTTTLIVGSNEGVFVTANNGTGWEQVDTGLTNHGIYSLASISDKAGLTTLLAGTDMGIYTSTDLGEHWSAPDSNMADRFVFAIVVAGRNIFAGTSKGVILSSNEGAKWVEEDYGLNSTRVMSLAMAPDAQGSTDLFAGIDLNGVWRRPISEMVTDVDRETTDFPRQFSLSQNYPNPFNPTTTISFSIPSPTFVSLKVFDILGRRVSTIVSGQLRAGKYDMQWNAERFSSGVYFYRLEAGTLSETKKLLLLK
jgi:hypothetical protein